MAISVGTAVAQQQHEVDVQDNSFAPDSITVTAGDTVVWTQTGSNPHSVTADDGSFDSHPNCGDDCMEQGDSFSHAFAQEGEYPYHCTVHGTAGGIGMAGVVVVEAAAQEDPDPEPTPAPTPVPVAAPAAAAAQEESERPLPSTGALPGLAVVLIVGGLAAALLTRRRR